MGNATSLARRREVLDALVRIHPAESTALGLKRDTCVFASWTGREILRRFGIQPKAVAVRAVVANAASWEAKDGDLDRIMNEPAPEGGWTLGVGFPDGKSAPGRWPGHLVLTARNPDVFIDLTLDQANRPERGIVLEPTLQEIPRRDLRRFESAKWPLAFQSDCGARVIYAMIPDLSPSGGTDWTGGGLDNVVARAARDRFVDRVEARIRRELDG